MYKKKLIRHVLAIDVGTTFIKYACINAEGGVSHYHKMPLQYGTPIEKTNIYHWFQQLVESIDTIPRSLRTEIAAVTVSGQGPSLLPLTHSGHIQVPLLFRATLDDMHTVSSVHSQSQYIPFALRYLQINPHLRISLHKWVPIPEYFVYQLCGKVVAMLPSKKYRRYYWTASALRQVGLKYASFPSYAYMGNIIAPLNDEITNRCGLPKGIPLFCGGLDFYMSIIGTDCYRAHTICDRAGSTQGLNFIGWSARHNPIFQPYPLLSRKIENNSLLILNSGTILRQAEEKDFHAVRRFMHNESLKNAPRLPTIKRKGMVEIPYAYTRSTQDRHEIVRALESILFTMRYAFDLLSIGQHRQVRVTLSGGQASVAQWNQLKADMVGVEFQYFQLLDAELLGGAAVVFCALKVYPSISDAASCISVPTQKYVPHISLTSLKRYQEFKRLFARYCRDALP